MPPQLKIQQLRDGIKMADSALDAHNFPELLLVERGARSHFTSGTHQFSWLGVSASATMSATASVRAWINAARRRIAKLEAA